LSVRIAIIADTHMPAGGRRRLPGLCVELIAASDLVVHAGDIMSPEALEELEAFGPPVRAVTGNMDGWELRGRLPETDEIEVEGATLAVVHDAGPSAGRLERMRRRFPGADAVVFGHSHIPLHERDGAFQIFNPGSPTERRRAPSHSMGLARAEDGGIEFELVVL
jgi:putative phosphoesterase